MPSVDFYRNSTSTVFLRITLHTTTHYKLKTWEGCISETRLEGVTQWHVERADSKGQYTKDSKVTKLWATIERLHASWRHGADDIKWRTSSNCLTSPQFHSMLPEYIQSSTYSKVLFSCLVFVLKQSQLLKPQYCTLIAHTILASIWWPSNPSFEVVQTRCFTLHVPYIAGYILIHSLWYDASYNLHLPINLHISIRLEAGSCEKSQAVISKPPLTVDCAVRILRYLRLLTEWL